MDKLASINGILVHQLPEACRDDVMDLFPTAPIIRVTHDGTGLGIYFKNYDSVQENIIRKNVIVRGMIYEIYPLVTNLTVHGIRLYASRSTIRKLMKPYGSVINLYSVKNVDQGVHKTISLTDDYRIVLGIPEVLANFRLAPVIVPEMMGQFQVTFFCRLCRQNGHKQHQCLNILRTVGASSPESVQYFGRQLSNASEQSEVSESSDCQNSVDDFDDGHSHNYSKFTDCEIAPKDCHSQHNKQRTGISNCKQQFSNPVSLPKKLPNGFKHSSKSLKAKCFPRESTSSNKWIRSIETPRTEVHEKNYSKTVLPGEISPDDTDRKASSSEKELPARKIETIETRHKEMKSERSQGKKRVGPQISRIIPPGARPQDIEKLINDAKAYGPRDLPFDVERDLRHLVQSRSCADLGTPELNLLRWIQIFLDKVKKERSVRTRDADPSRNRGESSSIHEEKKGDQQTSKIAEKRQTLQKTRSKKTDISPGITEAIRKSKGVLESRLLLNFLRQVRGRKNFLEVVKHFTSDRNALAVQLKDVIGAYFRSGKKGVNEDRDVYWIRNLCNRLECSMKCAPEQCVKTEHGNLQKQTSNNQSSETCTEKKQVRPRSLPISPGVSEVISSVRGGELSPELLSNFLAQARCRKNILEVADHFTANTTALVHQLEVIVDMCSRSRKRDPSDKKDIQWIGRLCQRLKQRKNAPAAMCIKTGHGDFKTPECSKWMNVAPIAVKIEPMDISRKS